MTMLTQTMATNRNNPNSPDFLCASYQRQSMYWDICQNIREGTPAIRENRVFFLPKFESEEQKEYDARVLMTFVNDHYAQTLTDHVGLIFAKMPELDPVVSDGIKVLMENIDGEGTHWQVFMQTLLEKALDYGHAAVFTDFPQVSGRVSKKDASSQKLRPYCSIYAANDIINWRVTTVGGVRLITQVCLRESFEEDDAKYGVTMRAQYRVISQEVARDANDTATGLGKITWELFREVKSNGNKKEVKLVSVGTGDIKGPEQIPLRIVYGGAKIAPLETRPHLMQLAYSVWQETQIESDYANVMHKCNVPTPIFIGRGTSTGDGKKKGSPIVMGQGIDIPIGGSAMILEPSGAALGATRTRLDDLRSQMARQGAFVHEGVNHMTATEASIYARQRNARLVRAARSLQDAGEGLINDIASFMQGQTPGSMIVAMDFAAYYDVAFAALCLKAYQAGVLPLDAMLTVLMNGKLPEDFDAEDVALRMMTELPPPALVDGNGVRSDKIDPRGSEANQAGNDVSTQKDGSTAPNPNTANAQPTKKSPAKK